MSTINENNRYDRFNFDEWYSKIQSWCSRVQNSSTLRYGYEIISYASLPRPITVYITEEMDFSDWAYTILTSKDRRQLSYHINRMSLDKMVFASLKKEIEKEERKRDFYLNDMDSYIDRISQELSDVNEELLGLESHLKWLKEKSKEATRECREFGPYLEKGEFEYLHSMHRAAYESGNITYAIRVVERDISALESQQSHVNSQLKSLEEFKADAVRDKKLHVGKARALYMLAKYAYATFGACVQYGVEQEDADKAKAEDLVNEFISMQREYHRADSCSSDDKIEEIQKYEKIINKKHTFSTAAEKLMGKGSGCDVCWG